MQYPNYTFPLGTEVLNITAEIFINATFEHIKYLFQFHSDELDAITNNKKTVERIREYYTQKNEIHKKPWATLMADIAIEMFYEMLDKKYQNDMNFQEFQQEACVVCYEYASNFPKHADTLWNISKWQKILEENYNQTRQKENTPKKWEDAIADTAAVFFFMV